jgi:hypothetical protein
MILFFDKMQEREPLHPRNGATRARSGTRIRGSPAGVLSRVALPFVVTIGGLPASVDYLGLTPTSVGLYQLNVRVPALPLVNHPLVVTGGQLRRSRADISGTVNPNHRVVLVAGLPHDQISACLGFPRRDSVPRKRIGLTSGVREPNRSQSILSRGHTVVVRTRGEVLGTLFLDLTVVLHAF